MRVARARLILRDDAQVLRASHPAGDIVLFSSPSHSVELDYYGRCKTLGTLYWENAALTLSELYAVDRRADESAAWKKRAEALN